MHQVHNKICENHHNLLLQQQEIPLPLQYQVRLMRTGGWKKYLFLKELVLLILTVDLYSLLLNQNPIQIIEITAITSPKFFLKAYIKRTDNSLFVITFFIFFGCMVCKKFTVEVCIFSFKYHQISIEIHQNLKFFTFS